ncbi:hypothetical protein GCM10028868_38960 [Virgibacillus kimchii]
MGTSLTALRIGLPAFILPFTFIFEPALILSGEAMETILSVITALIGLFALSYSTQQFYIRHLKRWESSLFLLFAVCLIFPHLMVGLIAFAGLVMLMVFIKFSSKEDNISASAS